MSSVSHSLYPSEPQTSTTLKWASDGELSALDLERILARLSAVDPAAHALASQGAGHAIAAGQAPQGCQRQSGVGQAMGQGSGSTSRHIKYRQLA